MSLAGCVALQGGYTGRQSTVRLASAQVPHRGASMATVQSSRTYSVRRGDTLWSIARRLNTTVAELMAHNGLTKAEDLRAETYLTVPGGPTSEPGASGPKEGQAGLTHGAAKTGPRDRDGTKDGRAKPDVRSNSDVHSSLSQNPSQDNGSHAMAGSRPGLQGNAAGAGKPSPSNGENGATAAKPLSGAGQRSAIQGTPRRPKSHRRYPLVWPADGPITSRFGGRVGSPHDGIDIGARAGSSVRAAADGVVVFAGAQGGYGNLIVLRHPGGLMTVYAHQNRNGVHRGQRVRAGQVIGQVGTTGRARGPHLHFEVRNGVRPQNPLAFLPP